MKVAHKRVLLTRKERRVLAELAKPVGQRDYSGIHGHTIHALERKGLYAVEGKSRRKRITAAGRAELKVPGIFDDLFKKKDAALAAANKIVGAALSRDRASKKPLPLTNTEIDAHPLLDQWQRQTCKSLRNLAKKEGNVFTMLEFAEVALRAAGNEYARVTDQGGRHAAMCDDAHRRAAILYVHEAIKAGPAIVAETAADRGTLRDLELLMSHL